MMKIIPLMVVFLILGLSEARADLSKKDVEEIRQIVREEVTYAVTQVEKRLSQRIDEVEKRLDQRIDELDKRVSSQINDLDKRLSLYLQALIALIGIFGGAFVVGWVKLTSKVAATEATLTEHLKEEEKRAAGKERLIVQQQEEIRQMKDLRGAFQNLREEMNRRLERLEKMAA
ncbi:MAG: hypothetical protein QME81_01220 [bacterium]|nr:hypothetical protein [bacterium]